MTDDFVDDKHTMAAFDAVVFNLRSDTCTRPTAAVRAAMANAVVGDDAHGRGAAKRRRWPRRSSGAEAYKSGSPPAWIRA